MMHRLLWCSPFCVKFGFSTLVFNLVMSCVIVLLFVMHCFYSGETHTEGAGQRRNTLLWCLADIWGSIIKARHWHQAGKWSQMKGNRDQKDCGTTLSYEAKRGCLGRRQQDVEDAAAVTAPTKTGSWLEISEKICLHFSPQHRCFLSFLSWAAPISTHFPFKGV